MEIRPLARGDRAQWSVLWHGYLAYYEAELPQETYDLAFERMLSGAEGEFRGLVATEHGRLLGLVHFLAHRHGWRVEKVIYLQDLYTAPDARGRGIASKLIEAVYATADAEGTPSVYWLTQEFNHTARRVYDRVATQTPFIKYQRP